jgi:transglutaminase-like putative cysteine protease
MADSARKIISSQRLNSLIATCLLASAAALGLSRVFVGHAAFQRLLVGAIASALIACAMEKRNLLLATLVSAAGLLVAIGILIFPESTLHGLPTTQTLHAIASASKLVGEQARQQVAPTLPLRPLMLAALTSVWAAIFSGHALAFRAGSPLLALLPPVALVAFADTVLDAKVEPIYGICFLVAALALLFSDGVRRVYGWGPVWSGRGRTGGISSGRGARRLGAGVLVVAAIAPFLLPGFGSKAVFQVGPGKGHVAIDLVGDMGAILKQEKANVFQVKTPGEPSYYKFSSLPLYNGGAWQQDPAPQLEPLQDAFQGGPGTDGEYTFTLQSDLDDLYLPVPYPTTNVTLTGYSPGYDASDSAITLNQGLANQTTYQVTARSFVLTPEQLKAEGSFPRSPDDPLVQLPSLQTDIKALAEKWTARTSTTYDAIMAIQSHLNDGSYSYSPVPDTVDNADALHAFLFDSKKGFCVQFAASMGILLRELHIPTRLVVGFSSGSRTAVPDTYEVTTLDAHMWVEVDFPHYGWLPFDPTPAAAGGTPPRVQGLGYYAHPQDTICPTTICGTKDRIKHHKNPTTTSALPPIFPIRNIGQGDTGRRGLPTPLLPLPKHTYGPRSVIAAIFLLAVLVLALVPPVRWARRKARLRAAAVHKSDPRRLILTSYDVFSERAAEIGYPRGPGETLKEYRDRLASTRLADGSLSRLTDVVSETAYAPGEPTEDAAVDAATSAEQAWKELHDSTPRAQRIKGAYRFLRF